MKEKDITVELVHPETKEVLGMIDVTVKVEDNYLEECGPEGKDERWRTVFVYSQIARSMKKLKKGEYGFEFF